MERARYPYKWTDLDEWMKDIREALDRAGIRPGEYFEVKPIEEQPERPHAPGFGLGDKKLGPFARQSEESRQAALNNYPISGTQRERILAFVKRQSGGAGAPGATRHEIHEATGMPGDTVRPRVKELLEGEWLRESDQTRPTPFGNEAMVLFATNKALLTENREEELAKGTG